MFLYSLIRAWILVPSLLGPLCITKQNVSREAADWGTCWLLLVSPAHYKHVWTVWKVKAAARVWSVSCSLWGETLRKCSFHNITFNFYWEATFKGIWITPSRDISNWSLFSFNEDIHKADPFSFNAPSESCDLSLSSQLTGSHCCPHCPACLPNQSIFHLHPGSEPIRDTFWYSQSVWIWSTWTGNTEGNTQANRWITYQDSWQASV